MLNINDMKDDAKVLAHLDDVLFVDSSVTLSEEEYLKNAIKDKLVYEGCISNSLFLVNESVSALEEAQMTYIFSRNPEDVTALLNFSLPSAPTLVKGEENVEERLKKETEQQGDLTSLIELTKKAEGSYRVTYHPVEDMIPAYFSIELPVTLEPSSLNWFNLSEKDTINFLENCLQYGAGVSQTLRVMPEMFSQEVRDFVADLPRVTELGFAHARNKAELNSVSFQTVKDPFKALFDGVIAANG